MEHLACMAGGNVYRLLEGKSDGKRPLGRLKHGWEDIKMDLKDVPNIS
jgi:hypothetical protein